MLDFDFIYELVKDKYAEVTGRPSIDPVVLIKIVMIQYLFGIRSMRQTVKDIEVNAAYRWFLGMGWQDSVPHFTTFGKNYSRRFAGTDLFEGIFAHILEECYDQGFVRDEAVFVDATHIKANANRNKKIKVRAEKEAAHCAAELAAEIAADREAHGKKPLKKHDDDDSLPPTHRKENKDKNVEKRIEALLLHAEGKKRKEIAEKTGFAKSYISELVSKYSNSGIEAIVGNHYSGNRRNMRFAEEEAFLETYRKQAERGQIIEVGEIKKGL